MRKALIYTIAILGLLVSCRAQKIDREMIYGTFTGANKSQTATSLYTLELKSDSAFFFNRQVHLGGSHCSGKWKIADNKVLLECNEVTDPIEALTRGGMSGVQELQIISKDKLKYKNALLKRKK